MIRHNVPAAMGETFPVIDYYMLRNQFLLVARHWSGTARLSVLTRTVLRNLLTIAACTVKSRGHQRLPHRSARVLALRDALRGRSGTMGPEVAAACYPDRP